MSLTLSAGEVYGLVGRNGAGKSTLARAVTGATRLDAGAVRVLGEDPRRSARARRAIGMAPQEIALYPRLTVAENLLAFAALAGVPRSGRRPAAAAAMARAACAERADERIETLSGGWRRRANLAAALVHDPRLLILDEPTEGLDAETRADVFRLLGELRQAGVAVLLISHEGQALAAASDRIGVLHAGRMLAEGPPAALFAEAFGGAEELVLRLRVLPDGAALEALRAHGLRAEPGGLTWRFFGADAGRRGLALQGALGGAVAELTVRAPTPAALVDRLVEARAA